MMTHWKRYNYLTVVGYVISWASLYLSDNIGQIIQQPYCRYHTDTPALDKSPSNHTYCLSYWHSSISQVTQQPCCRCHIGTLAFGQVTQQPYCIYHTGILALNKSASLPVPIYDIVVPFAKVLYLSENSEMKLICLKSFWFSTDVWGSVRLVCGHVCQMIKWFRRKPFFWTAPSTHLGSTACQENSLCDFFPLSELMWPVSYRIIPTCSLNEFSENGANVVLHPSRSIGQVSGCHVGPLMRMM